MPLPEPHPSSETGGLTVRAFGLPTEAEQSGRMCPSCTPGTDHSHYRSQRGGQDHFGPMPVRFDERAGRDDPLGRKAPGPKGTTAKGFLIMQDVNLQLFGDSVLAEAQLGIQPQSRRLWPWSGWIWPSTPRRTRWRSPVDRSSAGHCGWLPQRKRVADLRRTHQWSGLRPYAGGEQAPLRELANRGCAWWSSPMTGSSCGRAARAFLAVGGMTS